MIFYYSLPKVRQSLFLWARTPKEVFCSPITPSSSSPRLRPRPPWKRHNHDLFLMAKHLLWWCVGATSWKNLALELTGNLPSWVPGEASHWEVSFLRIAMVRPKDCQRLLAAECCLAVNCRVRSYRRYKVTGTQQKLGRENPSSSCTSTGKALY